MRSLFRLALVLALTSFVGLPIAQAQTLEEEQASTSATTGTTTSTATTVESGHALSDEQARMEEEHPRPQADDGITAVSDETNHDYFTFGFLARGVVIPDFMINAFVVYHGPNALNAGMGGFFSWRRNGLNVTAEVWYLGMGAQGFFHGIGDQDVMTEFVDSQLGIVFGNFVFQWAIPVTPWFSLDIGLGIGLGGVMGNLYRQEATPNPSAGYGYSQCAGPGNGPGGSAGAYCEGPVEHVGANGRLDNTRQVGGTYQITNNGSTGTGPNPFYFGDGGVPPIFGWIDLPRITARFTPIRQLAIRVDLSYNIYGFGFGGSIGYQL